MKAALLVCKKWGPYRPPCVIMDCSSGSISSPSGDKLPAEYCTHAQQRLTGEQRVHSGHTYTTTSYSAAHGLCHRDQVLTWHELCLKLLVPAARKTSGWQGCDWSVRASFVVGALSTDNGRSKISLHTCDHEPHLLANSIRFEVVPDIVCKQVDHKIRDGSAGHAPLRQKLQQPYPVACISHTTHYLLPEPKVVRAAEASLLRTSDSLELCAVAASTSASWQVARDLLPATCSSCAHQCKPMQAASATKAPRTAAFARRRVSVMLDDYTANTSSTRDCAVEQVNFCGC